MWGVLPERDRINRKNPLVCRQKPTDKYSESGRYFLIAGHNKDRCTVKYMAIYILQKQNTCGITGYEEYVVY
jgi:hypothetical protein